MAESKTRFSKPMAFFWLFRLNRTVMVATITGAAAFTAGAGLVRSLWMTLAGWCLAVGGFSLDFYADRDLDIKGPRAKVRHNPLADGSLAPSAGLAFSLAFIAANSVVTFWVAPWALLPWGVILAVVGLAVHLFETPLARALTLVFMMGMGSLICLAMILGSL
jgi:4-hydroxybenzoate polyprenyltransferase